MKEFDTALLESGSAMRRGVKLLVENVGRAIALITVIVTALVLFCDVSFASIGTERLTSTLVIMLISSYVMYFSTYGSGEEAGKGSEEYKNGHESYKRLASSIEGKHLGALREYLTRYSEEEARFRQTAYLMQKGYSYEDLKAYKAGGAVSGREKRIFKRADSIRPTTISPATLLSDSGGRRRSEICDPEARKLRGSLLKLLPMTLCSLFTVSVMLTAKDGLGVIEIIEGIFKLSSLLIIGLRGYLEGMTFSRYTLPAWLETKYRLLDDFLKSYTEKSDGWTTKAADREA